MDRTAATSAWDDYWERWRVVTLALRPGKDGFADPVEVIASYDPDAAVDSLETLARSWRWRGGTGSAGEVFAHFSRAPRSAAPNRALPARVVDLIRNDPKLSVWAEAWKGCLPAFDPGDFAWVGSGRFYRFPDEGDLTERVAFGLIAFTRDSSLALDPFAGIEVGSDSSAGEDPHTGFSTYDVRTKSRLHYDVSSYREIATAAWLDDSTFVMVGTLGLDHPASRTGRWIDVRASCVWVGNLRTEQDSVFLGPPELPPQLIPRCAPIGEVRPKLYPAVRWEW